MFEMRLACWAPDTTMPASLDLIITCAEPRGKQGHVPLTITYIVQPLANRPSQNPAHLLSGSPLSHIVALCHPRRCKLLVVGRMETRIVEEGVHSHRGGRMLQFRGEQCPFERL